MKGCEKICEEYIFTLSPFVSSLCYNDYPRRHQGRCDYQSMYQTIPPLNVIHLFAEMRAELLAVLSNADDSAWQNPTACAGWTVKDVALHVLGDSIGYLSWHRDQDGMTLSADSFDELVKLINQHNDLWVRANRRMSKRILLNLLQVTGDELHDYFQTVNPMEGSHPVAWSGKKDAPMWLQIARELTEYWMHHQHICEGLGIDSLKNRRFLHPVLSAFVHALPRTYTDVSADDGTIIEFAVTGEAADSWFLVREKAEWNLYANVDAESTCCITMSDDTAWRLFTKGITNSQAQERSVVEGDQVLGNVIFNSVAILA